MIFRQLFCATVLLLCAQFFFSSAPAAESELVSNADNWNVSAPPGKWRQVSIQTDETTWSFVDVSADGKQIIFDMLGDIYSVAIEGGAATPLTDGIAWNFQPRFSPDGREIAFISDRDGADNIWVMSADGGEPRQISSERENNLHNPYWAPDGDWIAARKGYVSKRSIPAGSIWIYHVLGGDGVMLVDRLHKEQSEKNIAEPAFSPDGRYLYYSQDMTSGRVWKYNKDATGNLFAIRRFDRQEGETETLVSGPGGAVRPIPSPDGKYLAFVRRLPDMHSALYLRDLASGNESVLFERLDRDNQETSGAHGNYPAYAWMPDSRTVVFWADGKIQRVNIEGGEPAVIPVTISTSRKVRESLRFAVDVAPDQMELKMLRWLQYSPDKKRALFQTLGHIYTHNVAQGKRKRLTRQNEHFEQWPSYSRDGKQIVYTTWNDQELGAVRVVSARGGRGRVITPTPGHYIEPRFSPDGKQVVYRKFSGGYLLSPKWSADPGIYLISSSGGDPLRVSRSGSDARFSGDGKRILFADKNGDNGLTLFSVDLQGRDKRTVAEGSDITEYQVSPDGRWLAFTEQFDAFVAPLPATGVKLKMGRKENSVPVRRVSRRSGESLTWSAGSDELHWSNGATLYSRKLQDAFTHLTGSPSELPEPVESGLHIEFKSAADKPTGLVAIVGAQIVTMRDADRIQEVIADGTVLVQGNLIRAVGDRSEVAVPAEAFVLDGRGKTVIPGLVDVHAHGGMASNEIVPQQNWMQYSNLAFGVTTIHDPSNDTSEIFAHAEMQRKGLLLGPRVFSTGTILYGALHPDYRSIIDNLEEARFHVRRLKEAGAISVKSYNQLRRDSRQQVVAAAQELKMMVVSEGGMKFQHDLSHIMDGHTGVEHALPIGVLYHDVVTFWAGSESSYTPTLGVAFGGLSGELYWYDRTEVWKNERLMRYSPRSIIEPRSMRRPTAPDAHYNHFVVSRQAKKLRDAGVKINMGSHGQREGLAAHWEIWMMVQGGFTPWEALRGSTADGAWHIGMDQEIGSIERGKLADLAIIEGNPLADIRESQRVTHTMINGRLYDVETMDEVGSGDFKRQPFYFELAGGDTLPVAAQQAYEEKAGRHHWRH